MSKKPCKECPYRKESLPGYLGEANYDPELFLQQLDMPELHPCHLAVDWESHTEQELLEAKKCVGALQFMNNSFMISRSQNIAVLQKEVGKNDEVISFKHNFIKHHRS